MSGAMTIKVPNKNPRIVAMKPGKDTTIIAEGNSVKTVLARARKAGVREPVLVFVPRPGQRYIY